MLYGIFYFLKFCIKLIKNRIGQNLVLLFSSIYSALPFSRTLGFALFISPYSLLVPTTSQAPNQAKFNGRFKYRWCVPRAEGSSNTYMDSATSFMQRWRLDGIQKGKARWAAWLGKWLKFCCILKFSTAYGNLSFILAICLWRSIGWCSFQ